MSVLHERPHGIPRSRACHALGLSPTGTYPRQRTRSASDGGRSRQARGLTGEQRGQVLDLVAREEH
jgi:hypothetical protein